MNKIRKLGRLQKAIALFIIQLISIKVVYALNIETQEYICDVESKVIILIIDPDLNLGIQTGLKQFENDLCNDGYSVIEVVYDFTDPMELRTHLGLIFALTDEQLEGAIFIGSIPWVYQKVVPPSNPESYGYEVISFQYYCDLDGEFSTSPGYSSYGNYEYSYDLHTGDVDWEIWCSILPYYKGDLNITIEAINRYFDKNHEFRVGNYNYQSNFLQIDEHKHADSIEKHNQMLGYMESGTYAWTPLCTSNNAQLYFDTAFNGLSLEEGYNVLSEGIASFTNHSAHGWIGASGDLSIEWVETNPVKTSFFWSGGCSVGNLDYDDLWLRSIVYSPTSDVLFAYGSTNSSGGLGTNENGPFGKNLSTQLSLGENFGNSILSHINVPLISGFIESREFHYAQPVIIGDPTLKLPMLSNLDITEATSTLEELQLLANYPNPFNPSTTIQYELLTDGLVTIQIFDMLGQLVATLVNSEKSVGRHSIIWNGTNQNGKLVPGGTYLARISTDSHSKTTKLQLLK